VEVPKAGGSTQVVAEWSAAAGGPGIARKSWNLLVTKRYCDRD